MPRHRYCSIPGCPSDATHKGKCGKHSGQHEKVWHDPTRQAIYKTKEWREFRLRRLALNPICEHCNEQSATEVHHIVPIADGGAVYSFDNTACLCKPDHSSLTMKEVRERHGLNTVHEDTMHIREL